ncbi:hypothetical protein OOK29_32925 [Streptomyces phaeochromogenes]|uniref:hypothetical protein n=1 Tax=Streptomyces phaeochromogenes TaxID=1923 RepID=UPI00225B82D1|nr:hypothetical protein [Streptomyces phaeochromogenes]MCX5602950.1 hypothetical protein [Streptomyces phaeochromogenes]
MILPQGSTSLLPHGAAFLLGDCINYSVATLSTVASGKSLPRWDVVKAYAEGCDATNEELAELHALWRRASARQKGANDTAADSGAVARRRTRGKSASSLAPASPVDGPSLPAPRAETTVFAEGSRRNRGVTASLTFADAVAPDVDEPTLSLRIPSQRNTPAPCPERSLTDPGNSVPALMRHARATQPGTNGDHSNPFATALALCTTPDHFIALMNMLCKRSGLTPPELSRHSKKARHPISKSTFHGILHGHKLPRTEVLHAVLQACGCPSDQWPLWHHTNPPETGPARQRPGGAHDKVQDAAYRSCCKDHRLLHQHPRSHHPSVHCLGRVLQSLTSTEAS